MHNSRRSLISCKLTFSELNSCSWPILCICTCYQFDYDYYCARPLKNCKVLRLVHIYIYGTTSRFSICSSLPLHIDHLFKITFFLQHCQLQAIAVVACSMDKKCIWFFSLDDHFNFHWAMHAVAKYYLNLPKIAAHFFSSWL